MDKRGLQVASAILAAIPVVTGIIGLLGTSDPLYELKGQPDVLLDSNLRFFGGLWLGLGIAMYWLVPRIDTQTVLFRALWGMIFLGGIGRLISMLAVAAPPIPFIGFTVLEIVGAPLLVLWQARLAQRA